MPSNIISTLMTPSSRTIHRSHPPRSFNLENGALHRCCTYLVFIEASSEELNPTKTEIIWFGTRASLKRLQHTNLSLHVGADAIKPPSVIRDLGVLLNSELSMRQHIGKLTGLCYYHLRRLKKIRRILGPTITCRLVSAFVSSRLDYCNSILAGFQSPQLRTYKASRKQRHVLCAASAHVTM